jgi:hypothetical protein
MEMANIRFEQMQEAASSNILVFGSIGEGNCVVGGASRWGKG